MTWKDKTPEQKLRERLKKRYGISLEVYRDMEELQQGVCAICSCRCTRNPRLSVDHNAETGAIRGLLCDDCNTGLGRFWHSAELLRAAAAYIDKHDN